MRNSGHVHKLKLRYGTLCIYELRILHYGVTYFTNKITLFAKRMHGTGLPSDRVHLLSKSFFHLRAFSNVDL